MQPKVEKVSVETISKGAAIERANLELGKVLENIMDPNTSLKAAREVNLKIKIKPSDDRAMGAVEIQATSKLAPVSEVITQVYIGMDGEGKAEIAEVIKQPELPFGENSNVTPMKEGTTNS